LKVENNLSDGTKDSRVLAVRKGGSFCLEKVDCRRRPLVCARRDEVVLECIEWGRSKLCENK
jgi:hypothetical protein